MELVEVRVHPCIMISTECNDYSTRFVSVHIDGIGVGTRDTPILRWDEHRQLDDLSSEITGSMGSQPSRYRAKSNYTMIHCEALFPGSKPTFSECRPIVGEARWQTLCMCPFELIFGASYWNSYKRPLTLKLWI